MEIVSGDDCYHSLDLEGYIFFYFTAPWCGPCQKILPDLEKLIHKLDDYPIHFFKIDIDDDENDELCETCDIKSVPSFLLFKDRTFLSRVQGADIKIIIDMLSKNCDFIKNN
tara:strand:+ start:717 stop:1052 length:336 start_codon:yes stop_codon:yes gene_type:complete